ncbi:MAG: hypothetical protein ACI94Y_004398 [Maribacter sp.]|jgi:hypothetical protein
MKNILLLFLGITLTINSYAQIAFEKGYYIDNSDQKIECLIKNVEWRNNPSRFEYKLSVDSDKKKETIENVKEFSVYDDFKYVRSKVKIDRSSSDINNLSKERRPILKEEELFLKVLLEGKANLYFYEGGNITRYFYNVENNEIKPLIYKMYRSTHNTIGKNNQYRQQLWNDLKCPKIKMNHIDRVEYYKEDLTNLFNKYNQCHGAELIKPEKKKKKDIFNLSLRPHLRLSSTNIKYDNSSFREDIDLGINFGFGIGVEAEFILPFNKNKWAVILEPTFQHFKTTRTNKNNIPEEDIALKYNSLELPIGVRYYIHLNDNSKIFINTSVVFDLSLNSSITSTDPNNFDISELEVKTLFNLSFGAGYKLNDKYSIELRYLSNRELFLNYPNLDSSHRTFEVIFGYTLF